MPLRQTTSGILAVKEHRTTIESTAIAVECAARKKWEGASVDSSRVFLSLGKQNQEQELGHMAMSRHVTKFIFCQHMGNVPQTVAPWAEFGKVCERNSKWNDLNGGCLSDTMLFPSFSFLRTQEQIMISGKVPM